MLQGLKVVLLVLAITMLFFCLLVWPRWTLAAPGMAVIVAVAFGWALGGTPEITAGWLPGQVESSPVIFESADIAANYPQMVVFKVGLKNLWVLLSLVALGVLWIYWFLFGEPTRLLYAVGMGGLTVGFYICAFAGYCFYFAWKWIRERTILKNGLPSLGLMYVSDRDVRYEFFDAEGNRFGGTRTASIWQSLDSNLVVVFSDPEDSDRNEPSFDLRFHRLHILDRIHWPEDKFKEVFEQ